MSCGKVQRGQLHQERADHMLWREEGGEEEAASKPKQETRMVFAKIIYFPSMLIISK